MSEIGLNCQNAIGADTGDILLSRSLGTPAPAADYSCYNSSQVIGITATPVIDASSEILYVIANTLVDGAPTYRLYALKLSDLTDAVPSVTIAASQKLTNGNIYQFNARVSRQRSALLLADGNVYAGFASYCDQNGNITRGWFLGWHATGRVMNGQGPVGAQ